MGGLSSSPGQGERIRESVGSSLGVIRSAIRKKARKAFALSSTRNLFLVEGFAHLQGIEAPEGVQGAIGKPPGRLRRGETLCDAGKER